MKIKLSKKQWQEIGRTAGWIKKQAIAMNPFGICIYADGKTERVVPDNGKNFILDELQKYVGGYVAVVYLDNDQIMVMNEEGEANSLPVNKEASVMIGDTIYGNVLICKKNMLK